MMTSAIQKARDVSQWITKAEAARILQCSERSIERWQRQGDLEAEMRGRSHARPEAVYDPAHVEALREKLRKPPVVLPPEIADTGVLAPVSAKPAPALDGWGELARHLAALSAFAETVSANVGVSSYVSLTDATRLAGLSSGTIRKLATAGKIATQPFGRGVRYRRKDLEQL